MPKRVTDLSHPYARAQRLMQILREECPWDREQTLGSLAPCTLEETHELLEAVDIAEREGDWEPLQEELGDVLLHILFYARLAEEQRAFDLQSVFDAMVAKMIRRHPHVFGEESAENASDVLRRWDRIKAEEKRERKSAMDGIPPLPALARARKIHRRARGVGFDWARTEDVLTKIREEIDEFASELEEVEFAKQRLADEFGDLLFTLVALGDRLELDAEDCLLGSCRKFIRRFRLMEDLAGGMEAIQELSMEKREALYRQAKRASDHR